MAEVVHNQPRALAPRKLEEQETLHTLNHWRGVFLNYYRRCQFYGYFLQPNVRWNNNRNRGFTQSEIGGLKRDPSILASDLDGFLSCLGSYLPFDYVSDKLISETTDLNSAWDIIYEIYDAEIDTTTYLDYATMVKLPQETYRNFYNRLVGFVRQHLPKSEIKVEGAVSPATGENLTVALLDSIAVHWLLSIDKRLIKIIKTEFATELKSKRLCQMIKTIASNIDELLARYNNQQDQINSIQSSRCLLPLPKATKPLPNCDNDEAVDMIVRRLERLEQGRFSSPKSRGRQKSFRHNQRRRKDYCSHCAFLNKQLGASLSTNHSSNSCNKQKLAVNVIETVYEEASNTDTSDEDTTYDEGESLLKKNISSPTKVSLQIDPASASTCPENSAFSPVMKPQHVCDNNVISQQHIANTSNAHAYTISDPNNKNSDRCNCLEKKALIYSDRSNYLEKQAPILPNSTAGWASSGISQSAENEDNNFCITADIYKIKSSEYAWNNIQKSKSPKVKCCYNNETFSSLLDTGAEINVLDWDFALKMKIGIKQTTQLAQAANKLPLDVCGQTENPITFQCITTGGYKTIFLGVMLVVKGLGVSCLIGEPGKVRNNIICLPRQKLIIFANGSDVDYAPYYSEQPDYTLVRALSTTMVLPNEQICFELPKHMSGSRVAVTPRPQAVSWLRPSIVNPSDGYIYLTNSSKETVAVKKHEHLADVRSTSIYELPSQPKFSTTDDNPDQFQFVNFAKNTKEPDNKYLHLIQVDPDGILSTEDRQIFHDLHLKFAHLFTPQPGKYNGKFGYVNNKLQFSSPPAPNSRTHVPNYSPSMNQILANKMDTLETWGVLVKPETVGVVVEFVSPSMLTPKPEAGEYRLVTDFGALNVYLKRVPNTSATIAQAKSRIARAKFVIHLDFSNYFYQNGLQKSDIKYLGTVHPFKGLRVYTCDPQGLKGASERSYEKLLRIYGDMVQSSKLAQMADGIHVLGDSIQELALNYIEVLNRADLCGLTFKPSKVIVCPRNINLFGWDLRGQSWFPTSHTVSALTNAKQPNTVKQLRSFLGSFKQLSASLPNYALTIHSLEKTVAGKKSAERLVWTPELEASFQAAKQLAANPVGITEPRPDDQLKTFSDYSADQRAVGGRLVIVRKTDDGEMEELIGGFYSSILDKHKKNWLPCEGEAVGIRLVLEHFQHHIRESLNTTIHYTDSQPCVLAWKRSQRGAFSSSSRIAAFLTGLSALPVELQYKPGKQMLTSDFASRNPTVCTSKRCQICQFVENWECIGDNASKIRSISIEDIKSGKKIMPMTQKRVWRNIQGKDPVHCKLNDLIITRQLPESKKKKGDYTKLKLLHNLYTQGKLYVDAEGLIMVKSQEGEFNGAVISIPPSLFPGVANALHIRLDHPSKSQLTSLIARYFYSPGWRSTIEEITDRCHQCAAVKQLPKALLEDTTTIPTGPASNFSADIIERASQKILIVRENFSQYTRGKIIPDQKSETLKEALIPMVIEFLPDSGTEIRVDAATPFQALQRDSELIGSILKKLNIKICIGRILNKNKNPTAENTIKEVQKEILRLKNKPGPISDTDLCLILRNINSRIRYNGFSSREILFRRNALTNKPIDIDDHLITSKQAVNRSKSSLHAKTSKLRSHEKIMQPKFNIGDLVFLRHKLDKGNPRELYIIEGQEEVNSGSFFLIRKMNNSLRQTVYRALPDELILAPTEGQANTEDTDPEQPLTKSGRPLRRAAQKPPGFHKVNTISKRSYMKHGWIYEDQDQDSNFFAVIPERTRCVRFCTNDENADDSEEHDLIDFNDSTSETSCNLSWDSSPDQYSLSDSQHDANLTLAIQSRNLFPESNTDEVFDLDGANVNSTPKNRRRMAVSQPPVGRSNAFRDNTARLNHAHVISPADECPDETILDDAIQSAESNLMKLLDSPVKPSIPSRTSTPRIPKPFSPEDVCLHQVCDVSVAAEEAFRRLSVPSPQPPPAPSRPRRSTKAPSNYMKYHSKGEF